MTNRTLLADSLWHYRRSHVAVALGVAVATAVLTGALLVGDSVRGSLRDLTLQRLGVIDYVLATPQPFRAALAEELAAARGFDERFDTAAPALVLSAAASRRTDDGTRRASDVTLLGVTPTFGMMDTYGGASPAPWEIADGEAWLTPALADELGAREGDDVFVTLPSIEAIPADSPLGEKSEVSVGRRLRVARVLSDEGLARFSLNPSQRPPRNAFASLATVQEAIDRRGDANLLLVGGGDEGPAASEWLAETLQPKLVDYGLDVASAAHGRAVQISSQQLVLPDAVVEAAERALGADKVQKIVSYLANTIRVGDNERPQVPYSTITGVDSTNELGPLLDEGGEPILLADDEVALNRWTADELGASVGDTIRITYYAPESTHGELVEPAPLRLRLAAIVPLETEDGEPTLAGDPRLTPEMEGVTDAETIGDWDTPFELVEEIRQADEDYWDEYSTTPKAFVSLDLARRLWGTRWGTISLLRVPADGAGAVDAVDAQLRAEINKSDDKEEINKIKPAHLGFTFQPIKQRGLEAASGTTPFGGLFFGFSMFLIASSVMLISLLYRLGVDQRAREVGLLTATGWTPQQIRRALAREGVSVAAVGALVGVLGGVGYAWLMLWGLRTLWVEAIVTPFLTLHVTVLSLAIGLVVGLLVSWATIRLSLRGLAKRSPRSLLAGQTESPRARPRAARRGRWLTIGLLALAIAVGALGAAQQGEAQAGAFFGSGALVLAALVLWVRAWLIAREVRKPAPEPFGIGALAARNVARNPGRTLLTIALVGAASFLILAISAFRLPPTEEGTGGYALVGESQQPLHYDLNTPEGRLEYGLTRDDEALLDRFRVDALRAHDGEDASCLNLYQTQQPRVLGAPEGFGDDAEFAWADDGGAENPWTLLRRAPHDDDAPIPVILDFNTAMYSLKLYDGVGAQLEIRDATDSPVTLEVVALLKNSVLQGDLLVSQENFLDLFPETGGFRFFLVKPLADDAEASALSAMLEDRLADYGLDLQSARERLVGFLAVQNTYLSTFQSLGALGLLLGAVGVAVVQLRNVEQRRGELALLRAAGYAGSRLSGLVLRENLLLLLGGLGVGAAAAAVALAPQTFQHETRLPWVTTSLLLAVIAVVGLVVGWLATRRALRAPILPALRGD